MKRSHPKLKSATLLLLPILLFVGLSLISSNLTQKSSQFQLNESNTLIASSEAPSATWNRTWGGANDDRPNGIAIDTSGNIYCVGSTNSFTIGFADLALVKYLPDGTKVWNRTWGGADNEYGYDVAVDLNGNIYCVGSTATFSASPFDLALVKFFPNGTKAWNITWDNTGSENGYGVAVDASGNIYCVGSTTLNNGDFVLVKFFPNKTKVWDETWGGSAGEFGNDVAIDSNGAIYCVGNTWSFGAGQQDLALVKYYPNGTKAWNTTWGAHSGEDGKAIAINSNDNIYCFGRTTSFLDAIGDLALIKFFPNGTRDWNTTWGETPKTENAYGMAINPCDEIYVTHDIEAAGIPLIIEKFTSDGTMIWNASWNGPGIEVGKDLAFGPDGAIYCIVDDYYAGQYDFLLVKFPDPLGCIPGGIPGFESVAIILSLFVVIITYSTRKNRKPPKIA